MKVFISLSGQPSERIAAVLAPWLWKVVPLVQPFLYTAGLRSRGMLLGGRVAGRLREGRC